MALVLSGVRESIRQQAEARDSGHHNSWSFCIVVLPGTAIECCEEGNKRMDIQIVGVVGAGVMGRGRLPVAR